MPNAVEIESLNLSLGKGASRVHILKDVALHIVEGEAVAMIGPSGSGKSSLLMTIAGLERPDSGQLSVLGRRLDGLNEDQLARFRAGNVGIVFQSFHLIPTMTALENVAVPLELSGVPGAFRRARAELEAVGLGHRIDHFPAQMSGGEQQRTAIARALAPHPRLILADEPTGNLDDETGKQIADLLFRTQAERGATMVLVTHDPALAARCGRAFRMRSGQLDTRVSENAA